ncbi:Os05g0406600-like protein, partial [Zea mays]
MGARQVEGVPEAGSLVEKLDALNRVVAVASRLGHRCAAPALVGFGHVYADLLAERADAGTLAAVASRSDAVPLVRRLDRVTATLYAELDALAELKPDASLWNWTYDRAVLLLAHAVCAIYGRIRLVFGDPVLGLDLLAMTRESGQCEQIPQLSGLVAADSGPVLQSSLSDGSGSISRKARRFGPKSIVTSLAPASTVGGSALALHYANIVIVIEKLLRYPHLVGEEARDELYQMLPRSLKLALRRSLRARARSTAIYD